MDGADRAVYLLSPKDGTEFIAAGVTVQAKRVGVFSNCSLARKEIGELAQWRKNCRTIGFHTRDEEN